MGLNNFRESYDGLFSFRITIVIDVLKCESQKPSSRQALVILVMFFKYIEFLRICLKCLHASLLGSGVNKLLHLVNALVTSSFKNEFHDEFANNSNLLRTSSSTMQYWAVLKVKYSACHRLSILMHGWPLYFIASIGSSLHLLIQFMSSQSPHFLFEISWILRLKN